jgi:hypothetical protein
MIAELNTCICRVDRYDWKPRSSWRIGIQSNRVGSSRLVCNVVWLIVDLIQNVTIYFQCDKVFGECLTKMSLVYQDVCSELPVAILSHHNHALAEMVVQVAST